MNEDKDIEKFDAIANQSFSKNDKADKGLLKSIDAMDQVMRKTNSFEVSANFTERLIYDAMHLKSNHSKNRIIRLLGFIFLPIITICAIIILGSSATVESPAMVTQTLEKFNSLLQFTSDPKVQQLFLISEGIILLIIIEKIASSYRFIRHSANG